VSGEQIHPSCCSGVFVDQPTEPVASLDLSSWGTRRGANGSGHRWRQLECSVWPIGVVVLDVHVEDALELSAADDQEPVEAVAADRSANALSPRSLARRGSFGFLSMSTSVFAALETPQRSAVDRFTAMGLEWHAEQSRKLLAPT